MSHQSISSPLTNGPIDLSLYGLRSLQEDCGIVGVWRPPGELASLYGTSVLANLDHRGHDSSGAVSVHQGRFYIERKQKRPKKHFTPGFDFHNKLPGNMMIGQTRYRTSGAVAIENTQPLVLESERLGPIAIGHNGNLVNWKAWKRILTERFDRVFKSNSDTEVALHLIDLAPVPNDSKNPKLDAVKFALSLLPGTFSFTILFDDRLMACCDPLGNRPLTLAETDQGYFISSEDSAMLRYDYINLKSIRDIDAGEIVEINAQGDINRSSYADPQYAHCSFDSLYLSHYQSRIWDIALAEHRGGLGEIVAQQMQEQGIDFDQYAAVVPIPQSALKPSENFTQFTGLPIRNVLRKLKKKDRTFIQEGAEDWFENNAREAYLEKDCSPSGVYKIIADELPFGESIILLDESVVRSNTLKEALGGLAYQGFFEKHKSDSPAVHIVVASPMVEEACNKGVKLEREKLIARRLKRDAEKMARELEEACGAKTGQIMITFMDFERFKESHGELKDLMCYGCMDPSNNPLADESYPEDGSPLTQLSEEEVIRMLVA